MAKKLEELKWSTEKRKIKDLVPYEFNPRTLTEKQAEQLKASITKFNLVEIPVINSDNILIAGHQRVNIMMLLQRGEEDVDVRVPNRKLSIEELKEYNIRSNKNTGSWDFDILANNFEMKDLMEWGFDDRLTDIFNSKDDAKTPETKEEKEASEKRETVIFEANMIKDNRDILYKAIAYCKELNKVETTDDALKIIADYYISRTAVK